MPGIRSSTRGRRQESRDLTTSFKPTALPFHRHGQGRDKDEDLDANNVFGNHASGSQGDDASHEDNSGDSSKDGGSGGNSDSDKSDPSNASQSSGGADGKSNSGIPGSNGSNDDQGHEDSFPGFCGAAPNPIPLDPSQCVFVNENDGRLKYGPGWTLATSDPSGERRTSHSTSTNGSSVVVDFNSTSIIVFGTVPQSNATFAPPSASYSIDGRRPIELMLPIASMCIPNQQLFRSPELPHGAHNLTISVTTLNGTSYTLDYLWFCTDKPTQSSNSTGVETKAVTKGDNMVFGPAQEAEPQIAPATYRREPSEQLAALE
ncbi:hypothetical protein BN946_scf184844.g101 [Trametes cinnabarina]|uniref:Uncharacterized protein n=1 Tax=Pycnoporus cinnabarinus TaxID=5643 RepID=A0A060S9A6_PYCCI|nr:hypothetical protein BN946_scf184844.g101 [Trametes cinnabarina]